MASATSDSTNDGAEWDCPALFPEPEGDFRSHAGPGDRVALPLPACYVFGSHAVCLTTDPHAAIATKVWRGALILARALLAERELVEERRVLELGCGVGLCGILASLLGASHVVLSDCSWEGLKYVLLNVNCARSPVKVPLKGSRSWGTAGDPVQIRWHLWETDEPRSPGRGPPRHWSNEARCTFGEEGEPPRLEASARFDVVIGADVLYFHQQVAPLAATVGARLAQGGVGLLTLVVRKRDVYISFIDKCEEFGLAVVSNTAVDVDPLDEHYLEAQAFETASAQEVRLLRLARAA